VVCIRVEKRIGRRVVTLAESSGDRGKRGTQHYEVDATGKQLMENKCAFYFRRHDLPGTHNGFCLDVFSPRQTGRMDYAVHGAESALGTCENGPHLRKTSDVGASHEHFPA